MIIEGAGQELLQGGGESLVNILIKILESNGILQEITNTELRSGLRGKQVQCTLSKKNRSVSRAKKIEKKLL